MFHITFENTTKIFLVFNREHNMAQSARFFISSKVSKLPKPIHRKIVEDKTRMQCLEHIDTDGKNIYKTNHTRVEIMAEIFPV